VLSVSLLGFFKGDKFERGIKELPLIDNECYLLQEAEFFQVHNFVAPEDRPLVIGSLALEKGQSISLGVNELFASHIGIFGNTGSGKSYTLAKLYRELFEAFKDSEKFQQSATFVLIDFNGEYVDEQDDIIVDKARKQIYKLSTRAGQEGNRYPLNKAALSSPEFWTIFLEATEKTQTPFIRRVLDNGYIQNKIADADSLKGQISDTLAAITQGKDKSIERALILRFIRDLQDSLHGSNGLQALHADYSANLTFHKGADSYLYGPAAGLLYADRPNFRQDVIDTKIQALDINLDGLNFIEKIRLRIVLSFYDEIIRGFSNREHLAPMMTRLDRRINDLMKVVEVMDEELVLEQNITIVSLKEVNLSIRKVLPLLICKKLYEEKKANGSEDGFLNLIIDEAHNILSERSERESEQWRDYRLETFEEIIKEGRKFGVFLTIASQRPADISPTIVSQLHHYFLHRLINNEDIRAVEKTISYLDRVSFETLPILPTGTCIFAGLSANVPVMIDIGRIEPAKHEPRNKTMTLLDKWA
jgi:DNA helicase HerA-like ATPase